MTSPSHVTQGRLFCLFSASPTSADFLLLLLDINNQQRRPLAACWLKGRPLTSIRPRTAPGPPPPSRRGRQVCWISLASWRSRWCCCCCPSVSRRPPKKRIKKASLTTSTSPFNHPTPATSSHIKHPSTLTFQASTGPLPPSALLFFLLFSSRVCSACLYRRESLGEQKPSTLLTCLFYCYQLPHLGPLHNLNRFFYTTCLACREDRLNTNTKPTIKNASSVEQCFTHAHIHSEPFSLHQKQSSDYCF